MVVEVERAGQASVAAACVDQANTTAQAPAGILLTERPFMWTVAPAASAQGVAVVATKAAPGAGLRHVVTGFIASVVVSTVLAAGETIEFLVRANGGATILARGYLSLPNGAAVGQTAIVTMSGLSIPTPLANQDCDLLFATATANARQSVTLMGYTTG